MQTIKQFQNSQQRIFASVVCEPRQSLLMDIWNGQPLWAEDMAQVLDYSLLSIKECALSCWLSEVSKLERLFELDSKAAEQYLIRHLSNASLRKFAFIYRHENTEQTNRIIKVLADLGVVAKGFSTSVMAMQWLLLPAHNVSKHPMLEV